MTPPLDIRLLDLAHRAERSCGPGSSRGSFFERSFMYSVGMPRPREFEPDEVLDTVMRQFWERGYRATSVDDLVRASGVKPGSLYSAFPGGKHALLMGSLERYS